MSAHLEAAHRNLVPLSVAKSFRAALLEWRFTGATKDHGDANATCELCEQEQLRYHFDIANDHTRKHLWVGSQCILKFGVGVYHEGTRLAPTAAKKKLMSLVAEMRFAAALAALQKLAEREHNDILRSALAYYGKHGVLTPRFANVVLWRLSENGIDHSPSFFKISLRRDKHKEDLREMARAQVHRLWPALTIPQRKLAISFGHTPPDHDKRSH